MNDQKELWRKLRSEGSELRKIATGVVERNGEQREQITRTVVSFFPPEGIVAEQLVTLPTRHEKWNNHTCNVQANNKAGVRHAMAFVRAGVSAAATELVPSQEITRR